MPMLRRRELAAYLLLYRSGVEDYGEAIETVRRGLCTTKRTARRIVKRLARVGAIRILKEPDRLRISIVEPEALLEALVSGYIGSRRSRCEGMTKAVLSEEGQ